MPSIMYGIHRTEKFKKQDITGIQKEATRTADHYNNDVDITKSQYNVSLINYDNWNDRINEIVSYTGVKTRKDSIVMIGGLYAATGEFFLRHDNESKQEWQKRVLGYFRDCLDWHVKTYCQGNKDLMLSAEIHADEQNLHMQVYSVPIVDRGNGKYALSAKSIMGNRKAYVDRVDNFYNDVSKKYGLARGERTPEGQEAKKHIETQKYKLLKMQQELTETRAELTNVEHDKIIADFDKMELDQQIKITESKKQKLYDEINGLQQRAKNSKQQIQNLQQQIQNNQKRLNDLQIDNAKLKEEIKQQENELQELEQQIIITENKKQKMYGQIYNMQGQIKKGNKQLQELQEKIQDKQITCNEITEDMAKRLDLAKKLNKITDELADKYENDYQLIDEALQITNMLQEEYADIYNDLQSKLNNPVAELYVDDEEIEL